MKLTPPESTLWKELPERTLWKTPSHGGKSCAIWGGMTERAPSKVTKEDINGPDPLTVAFDRWGITPSYLANKLKAELNAKEIKVFHDAERGVDESRPMIAWDIRQRARQDAHKLRGDYPPERREIGGIGGGPLIVRWADEEGEADA